MYFVDGKLAKSMNGLTALSDSQPAYDNKFLSHLLINFYPSLGLNL